METDSRIVRAPRCVFGGDSTDGWEELAERVGTRFSSRPTYVLNIARATARETRFVGVRRDGRLVACAPLTIVSLGPVRVATLVGSGLGVPLEFLSEDAEASDALLDAIAALGCLLFADSVVAGDRTLDRLRRRSWTSSIRVREHVPVMALPKGHGARQLRSAKSLKRLRRYRDASTNAHSSFDIEVVVGVEHLDARWDDIARVARDAVRGTDRIDYLVSPEGSDAKGFLRAEADAGRLVVVGLVLDGNWVAHEIGLLTGDRIEGWLTHYDSEFRRVQPGHQLAEWFANNHDSLDVLDLDRGVGVNEIKSAWTNAGYDVLSVCAVPSDRTLSGLQVWALRQWEFSMSIARLRHVGHAVLKAALRKRATPVPIETIRSV